MCYKARQFYLLLTRQMNDSAEKTAKQLFENACARHQAGELDAAIAIYRRALEVDQGYTSAWTNLGVALRALGRFDIAADCYQHALELNPNSTTVLGNYANVLKDLGRFEESYAMHCDVLKRRPDDAHAYHNRGIALRESGDHASALKDFDEATGLDLDLAGARWDRALTLLQLGRYREAWPDYESRWQLGQLPDRHEAIPRWCGEPLDGKKILIYPEQGFGDAILVSRFLSLLNKRNTTVTLETRPETRRLFSRLDGVDNLLDFEAPPPEVDYCLPLMSLPGLLGATLDDLPPLPRLWWPAELGDKYRALFDRGCDRCKIGIVWSGSVTFKGNRVRATTVERFLSFVKVPGVQLYSLQKGLPEADITVSGADRALIDCAPVIRDFADTAALIDQLDLVITTDNAVAHLAGSLNKPVWNLLCFVPYWPYGMSAETTPWYPSMRLFRQQKYSDWDSVFVRAKSELAQFVTTWQGNRTKPVSSFQSSGTTSCLDLSSAWQRADGSARFVIRIPGRYTNDPGLRVLMKEEFHHGGYEYATRQFFDEHLQPGDLLIDVGAHWGVFSLHGATLHRGSVKVLAIEPDRENLKQLRDAITRNHLSKEIEVIAAAAGAGSGVVPLVRNSTMGHSPLGYGLAGSMAKGSSFDAPLISIDRLLQERPELDTCAVFVKIDVEGYEPEVIEGMRALLDSGRVKAIVWEYGRAFQTGERRQKMLQMVDSMVDHGLLQWRFPHPGMGGPLVPFAPTYESFNVFALSSRIEKRNHYPNNRFTPASLARPCRPPSAVSSQIVQTERLIEWKATDCARWIEYLSGPKAIRIAHRIAAQFVSSGSRVLDIGAGHQSLRSVLPRDHSYYPADLIAVNDATILIDLNQGHFPSGSYDIGVLLGIAEFVHDPEKLLRNVRAAAPALVISYPCAGREQQSDRRQRGYFNDLTAESMAALLTSTGWRVDHHLPQDLEDFWVCTRS